MQSDEILKTLENEIFARFDKTMNGGGGEQDNKEGNRTGDVNLNNKRKRLFQDKKKKRTVLNSAKEERDSSSRKSKRVKHKENRKDENELQYDPNSFITKDEENPGNLEIIENKPIEQNPNGEYEKLREEIDKKDKLLEECTEGRQKDQDECKEKLDKAEDECFEKLSMLEKEAQRLLGDKENKINELNEEIKSCNDEKNDIRMNLEKKEKQIEDLRFGYESVEKHEREIEEEKKKLDLSNKNLLDELGKKNDEIRLLSIQLFDLRSDIKEKDQMLLENEKGLLDERDENEIVKGELERSMRREKDLKRENERLGKDKDKLEFELGVLREEFEQITKERGDLKNDLVKLGNELKKQAVNYLKEIQKIKDEYDLKIDELQKMSIDNDVMKELELLKGKREGDIKDNQKLREDLKKLGISYSEKDKELNEAKVQLEDAKDENKRLEEELTKKKRDLEENVNTRGRNEIIEKENENLKHRHQEIEKENKRIKEKMGSDMRQIKKANELLEQKNRLLDERINQLSKENNDLTMERDYFKREFIDKKQEEKIITTVILLIKVQQKLHLFWKKAISNLKLLTRGSHGEAIKKDIEAMGMMVKKVGRSLGNLSKYEKGELILDKEKTEYKDLYSALKDIAFSILSNKNKKF